LNLKSRYTLWNLNKRIDKLDWIHSFIGIIDCQTKRAYVSWFSLSCLWLHNHRLHYYHQWWLNTPFFLFTSTKLRASYSALTSPYCHGRCDGDWRTGILGFGPFSVEAHLP
jgi:hypothetical protein